MTFLKGDFGISVFQLDGFGKRPSLWIVCRNRYAKVASFRSNKSAVRFLKWLRFFLDSTPIDEEDINDV